MKNNEKYRKNWFLTKNHFFFNRFWAKLADVGTALPADFLDFYEKNIKKIGF